MTPPRRAERPLGPAARAVEETHHHERHHGAKDGAGDGEMGHAVSQLRIDSRVTRVQEARRLGDVYRESLNAVEGAEHDVSSRFCARWCPCSSEGVTATDLLCPPLRPRGQVSCEQARMTPIFHDLRMRRYTRTLENLPVSPPHAIYRPRFSYPAALHPSPARRYPLNWRLLCRRHHEPPRCRATRGGRTPPERSSRAPDPRETSSTCRTQFSLAGKKP